MIGKDKAANLKHLQTEVMKCNQKVESSMEKFSTYIKTYGAEIEERLGKEKFEQLVRHFEASYAQIIAQKPAFK